MGFYAKAQTGVDLAWAFAIWRLMKAKTNEEMIAFLQGDYDWIIKLYRDPDSPAYNLPGVRRMLRDDLRAILHLRRENG